MGFIIFKGGIYKAKSKEESDIMSAFISKTNDFLYKEENKTEDSGSLFNKEWIDKQILSVNENPTEFALGIFRTENCGVYSLIRRTGKVKDLVLMNQIFNDKKKFDDEVKMISLLFNPIILEETA